MVPLFYERREGLPTGWLEYMKASIAAFSPVFSTHRMVGEYATRAYMPAAAAWRRLTADGLAGTREMAARLERARRGWGTLKILDIADDAQDEIEAGRPVVVTLQAHLGELGADDIRPEVVFGPCDARGEVRTEGVAPMLLVESRPDGVCRYVGSFVARSSGRNGYAVRVVPALPPGASTADTGLVAWG